MSINNLLEPPVIEDTLFGYGKMVEVQADEPDSDCYCSCPCESRLTKVSSSQMTTADLFAGMPQP
jgi:hypothetical protein